MDFRLRKLGEYVPHVPQIAEICKVERTYAESGERNAYITWIFAKQRQIIGMIERVEECEVSIEK